MNRRVVISGCSGGGKSTLLVELERRGFRVVQEPGRRVVQAELRDRGNALPWTDLQAFLHKVVAVACDDIAVVGETDDWVFFDRGLVDAAAALRHLGVEPRHGLTDLSRCYHQRVFLAPPWPEIYVQDAERRHGLETATAEYTRLLDAYPALGYHMSMLPKTPVAQRADFLVKMLRG